MEGQIGKGLETFFFLFFFVGRGGLMTMEVYSVTFLISSYIAR